MVYSNKNIIEPLQNMSTSGIWQILKTFHILYNIQNTCIHLKKGMRISQYCYELIQENNNFIQLNNVIKIKTNEIRSISVNLLNLEKQAVACKGTRHLLYIIIYCLFINNILNKSTDNYSSDIEIFDELFKIHSSKDQNLSFENTIEEIEEFINNEKSIYNKNYSSQYCKINQSKEKLIETYNIFIGKIKKIIQYYRHFITKELKMFHELYEKIHKVIISFTINTKNYRGFLLFTFKELFIVYKTECFPGADVALLLKPDHILKNKQKICPITRLTKTVDQLFINAQKMIEFLFIRFFPIISGNITSDISMAFYHSCKMNHDPEIWRLIGNEIIIEKINSSEGTVLNNIILKKVNQVNNIINKLTLSIENSVKCRSLRSINQTIKSHYYTIQVLIENIHKIQKTSETIAKEKFAIKEYIEKVSADSSHIMNLPRQELSDVFNSFFDIIKNLVLDQYYTINDSYMINSIIDVLIRDRIIKNEFKSVFIIYSKYNFYQINEIIQTITLYVFSLSFEMNEFESMLKDTERTVYKVESETVEKLIKLYKWITQRLKNHNCFPNDDNKLFYGSDENFNTKITLDLIEENNQKLHKHLEYDLRQSAYFMN